VDGEHQLFDRGLKFHGDDALGDELSGVGADDVYAEDFAVLGVGDDLHKAIVRIKDGGLGVAHKWKLADLDLVALLLGVRFCQTDRADLWVAIGAAGDAVFADGAGVFAGELAGDDDSTHGANVRKLRQATMSPIA